MDFRQRRLRTALMLGTAFLAGVTVAPATGILGNALAQKAGSAQMYQLLKEFGDVVERVRADYVQAPDDRELIENGINGMLTGLDAHSSYMNAKAYKDMQIQTKGEFGGLGIEVTQDNGFIKVVSPIDDTPAFRAGIKSGDIITALDGKTVQGLSLNDAVEKMRGPPNAKIVLTIKRQGVDKPLEVPLIRETIHIQVIKSRMEADNIGYIRLSQFTEQADRGLRDAIKSLRAKSDGKMKALILDLRNNPGGLLDQAVSVSSEFLDKGEIVSTRARHPEDSNRWNAKGNDLLNGMPIVVLINGGSASASEIVAGALQDHRRAILLGTRSFGKGSVQTVIPLPGNGAMRLTTARYYTPSGRSIQGLGIEPEVTVSDARDELASFGGDREADLNRIITNKGGTAPDKIEPRTDLPPMVSEIPKKPPEGFPKFDPMKPSETDFQLQQGLVLVKAMVAQKSASAR
jgi:carboxyl-terminal processing protease